MDTTKIIDFFCEVLSLDEITTTTKLTEEYGFEPIDIARLVIASEEEFNISIYDEYVSLFKTVGDLADYIKENLPEPEFLPEQLIYESSQS